MKSVNKNPEVLLAYSDQKLTNSGKSVIDNKKLE